MTRSESRLHYSNFNAALPQKDTAMSMPHGFVPLIAPAPSIAAAVENGKTMRGDMAALVMLSTVQFWLSRDMADLIDSLHTRGLVEAEQIVREWADRAGMDLPPMK